MNDLMEMVVEALTNNEVEVKKVEDNLMIANYQGIPVLIVLTTQENPMRIRFSVNVEQLKNIPEDKWDEMFYRLLDLNTVIDPVSAAIDSTDPENILIQARTSLRDVDLQYSEIVAEFRGLMGMLPAISDIVRDAKVEKVVEEIKERVTA